MKKKIGKNFADLARMIDFAIKHPDIAPDKVVIISMSEKKLNEILTPARLGLIRVIKTERPKSVSELAKAVKRPLESVSRDLKILHNYGFLEFIKNGKEKAPKIEKNAILIPLSA